MFRPRQPLTETVPPLQIATPKTVGPIVGPRIPIVRHWRKGSEGSDEIQETKHLEEYRDDLENVKGLSDGQSVTIRKRLRLRRLTWVGQKKWTVVP